MRDTNRSPSKGNRSESSLAGEDPIGSDMEDRKRRKLRQLKRDVRMANERLQRARSDLEDELASSPRNSKELSSQEDTSPRRERDGEIIKHA